MSLLKKSHENYKGFLSLREKGYCTPAVHCCYYSCFQKIVHILKEYYPNEYSKIKEDLNKSGSHSFQITTFIAYYSSMYKGSALDVKRMITQLRHLRISADYEEELTDKSQLDKVAEYSDKIHFLLKKDLQIDFE